MVGGIAGYDEETRPRMKTYREFREELNLFLEEEHEEEEVTQPQELLKVTPGLRK